MKLKTSAILFTIFLSVMNGYSATVKTTRNIYLGETEVKINVYENPGPGITFVVPHHNEQVGLKIAREYVDRNGGRLVEIESFDKKGNPARNITFTVGGKSYTVDPNRIFTANGRACNSAIADVQSNVEAFAASVLSSALSDGKKLFDNDRFIVAVHNNTNIDAKPGAAKSGDLTAFAFLNLSPSPIQPHGIFHDQADGVYLSNLEDDPDNFIFLSDRRYLSFFSEKGFNVVIQRSAAKLKLPSCSVDDGSLSVFSAQYDIPYICLEADAVTGGYRQRMMMEAVYQLAKMEQAAEPPQKSTFVATPATVPTVTPAVTTEVVPSATPQPAPQPSPEIEN